jgi:hypothetical protein
MMLNPLEPGSSQPTWRSSHLNLSKLTNGPSTAGAPEKSGIFAIEKFPDATMVGREVVVASFETGDSVT